tara:strand:- start:648 stop:1796 length:1149 start_codon:yes stop_codon:yes gene_type:complete
MIDFRKKRMVGVFVLWNILFFFITFVAEAHRIRPAITSLYPQAGKSIRTEIQVNLEALIAGIGMEHQDTDDSAVSVEYNRLRAMPSAELQQVFQGLASKFMMQMEIRLDGRPAAEGLVQVVIAEQEDLELARSSVIVLELPVSSETSRLDWKMSPEFGDHVIRLMNREDEVVSTQWVRNGERSPPVSLEGLSQGDFLSRFLGYMKIGFTHILPKGLDHILFVLGLFLLSARWKPLLIQVTSFTVAHTATLSLSMYGIASVPTIIVEPLIALSIVYVGLENVMTKELKHWRPFLVFLFGLLHGLGFAGVLGEIGIPKPFFLESLIAFNLGVELGQLVVIGIAYLLVGWIFSRRSWYRMAVVIPGSLTISLIGVWWVYERVVHS